MAKSTLTVNPSRSKAVCWIVAWTYPDDEADWSYCNVFHVFERANAYAEGMVRGGVPIRVKLYTARLDAAGGRA